MFRAIDSAAEATYCRSASPLGPGRRSNRYEGKLAFLERLGIRGGKDQAAGCHVSLDQLIQSGLVDRHDPLLQVADALVVHIQGHDAVSQVRKTRTRHQAHITDANHADLLHEFPFSSRCRAKSSPPELSATPQVAESSGPMILRLTCAGNFWYSANHADSICGRWSFAHRVELDTLLFRTRRRGISGVDLRLLARSRTAGTPTCSRGVQWWQVTRYAVTRRLRPGLRSRTDASPAPGSADGEAIGAQAAPIHRTSSPGHRPRHAHPLRGHVGRGCTHPGSLRRIRVGK